MTHGHWLRWRLCIALIGTTLAGCAGLSVDRMLPTDPPAATPRVDRTLRVASVTGGRSPDFGGPAVVSSEMMREALLAALRRSNLFRGVDAERPGDYDLHAQIHDQTQNADSLDYVATLGVRYRLVDTRSGAEVWRRDLNSRYLVAVSSALSGATRTVTAREQSLRDNLTRLVKDLAALNLQ